VRYQGGLFEPLGFFGAC